MFLKVPVIIIMRFGENNILCPKYINIYEFGGVGVGMYIFHRFLFFPRTNNKTFRKRGPQGALLLFLYEVSIVVLIDFIAILLPPGIFLIQIVNTNNTNMYLNSFS